MAAAIRVSPCLSFFPPLWGITRQREWEAIITSLMWAACVSHLQKKKKKGTRTPDHRTHLRLYRAKSPLGCGRSLQDDARRHQTIWLLANTMTWWERTLGSRLYAAISQRCKGWMVKTCDHSLVHQEVPWVQSLHHLPGKEKERERERHRTGQNAEQTANDNGGESGDVCVLGGWGDNREAWRKKSRGGGDRVASAVGNEDGRGRSEADRGVQRWGVLGEGEQSGERKCGRRRERWVRREEEVQLGVICVFSAGWR